MPDQQPRPHIRPIFGEYYGYPTRVLTEAGGSWNRYASGDHDQ